MAKGKKKKGTGKRVAAADPMTLVLSTYRKPEASGWDSAWAGMEPTFSNAKAVKKWRRMSETPKGEERYFEDAWMLKTEKRLGRAIEERYERWKKEGRPACMFETVERERDVDPWGTARQNLHFRWGRKGLDDFEVKLGIDPEIFEFSIKPVPIAWFYDERFVEFLQAFVWDVPISMGLLPSMAHGGGQFSLSAKTYLTGSLLADHLADRLNHPEMATWITDWPNSDDRSLRATTPRLAAFRRVIERYWEGAFHPSAIGVPTLLDAFLDRGFGPATTPVPKSMDPVRGPRGSRAAVFQTNFAFGRSVRWQAQNVDPGYWQSAHPKEEGYRPDQIMRYGEVNLNRLQVKGEWHVKRTDVLDAGAVPEASAPLEPSSLATEASVEDRGQMGRTSARDFVEALLLDVHSAMHLQKHPHPALVASLEQDRLLADAEATLAKAKKGAVLTRLRREARTANLESSRGRLHSDWIEPESLFWAAWSALSPGDRSVVAEEAVSGFVKRVKDAAAVDPRSGRGDPMEVHRHRVHPLLWLALGDRRARRTPARAVKRELDLWREKRRTYLARRPRWSFGASRPPWDF